MIHYSKMWRIPAVLLVPLLLGWASAWAADAVVAETLDNGLRVLLLEDHRSPIVSFQVWYRVGSRNEARGATGIAHFLEHMMFKGTPTHGRGQFARLVEQNGGQDNAFTSHDVTSYFVDIAADKLDLVIELDADRMQNLLLDPKEIDSERQVVLEERRTRTDDDPGGFLGEEVASLAFRAHPYGFPVIGWREDIARITPEEIRAFYRTYYVPNNVLIVAVGDFRSGEALDPLERLPRPEVADGDDQHVVRDVVCPVEGADLLGRDPGDVFAPADDREAVGVRPESERGHLLTEEPARVVVGARPPLLEDHLALRVDLLGVEQEVLHAVGVELDHEIELVRGDVDEVRGDVMRGERVVLAAVLLDEPGELATSVGGCALEHHVLEEVRDPGRATRLVARAHPIPDLEGHDRAAVVLQQQHPQPVVERLRDDSVRGPGRGPAEEERNEQDGGNPPHLRVVY